MLMYVFTQRDSTTHHVLHTQESLSRPGYSTGTSHVIMVSLHFLHNPKIDICMYQRGAHGADRICIVYTCSMGLA